MIVRSCDSLLFQGFKFQSWDTLQQQLKVSDLHKNCIFSDLSMGGWQGHVVELELFTQLNLSMRHKLQPAIHQNSYSEEDSSVIGHFIDNESIGDVNFITAYNNCKEIILKIQVMEIKWVIIIAPSAGIEWGDENIKFISLLHSGLNKLSCNIAILFFEDSIIPNHWQMKFDYDNQYNKNSDAYFPIPGIIDSKLVMDLGILVPNKGIILKNGCLVVSPDNRRKKNLIPQYLEKLRTIKKEEFLIVAFECLFPSKKESMAWLMLSEASKRFSEGGYSIALKILSSLKTNLLITQDVAAIVTMQMQSIRMALMLFDEAANENVSYQNLSDLNKAFLYHSKGWGLVMTNKHNVAKRYFRLAIQSIKNYTHSTIYLYLLNISALNELKLGKISKAFSLEKKIEKILGKKKKVDWHMVYINSINIARLYKKTGDYDSARVYYKKAFSVNLNLKNDSDLLYSNFCYAQLEKLQNRNDKAFLFLLKSCIHYLVNETPEALAPRIGQALLNRNVTNKNFDVEEISRMLLNALTDCTGKLNYSIVQDNIETEICFRKIFFGMSSPKIALGVEGFGIFASSERQCPFYVGKFYQKLILYTYNILCILFPRITQYSTIYIEDQLGTEIPSSFFDLLNACIKYKVRKIIFNNKKIYLDEKIMNELLLSSRILLSPAISFVTYNQSLLIVHYKRYKKPLILTELEKDILEFISCSTTIADIYTKYGESDSVLGVIRNMENKRLINTKLKENTSILIH